MTQLLRMQQVLSGHVKSDGGEVIEVKDNRINELMDCLEEVDGKAIIWSRFRYDVKRITEALTKAHGPGSTVCYFGDTTDEERSSAIEQFQNGKTRFGQTDHVTYIDLISEGTIDERIVKALRSKMDIASLVLGEELKEWLR
jgi:SNF2 family DNA or RNA helicase